MLNSHSNPNGASPDAQSARNGELPVAAGLSNSQRASPPTEGAERLSALSSRNGGAPPARSYGAPRQAAPSAAAGDSLDIGTLLDTLWRRRRLMGITFASILLLGLLVTLRQRSVYEATCSILISPPTESSPAVSDSLRGLLNASQPRSVGTQLAIMRSYPVQRATLKRLQPEEQTLAKKYYKLDVRPQRDADAVDIVAESYSPQVAARLANALTQQYMAQYQAQNHIQVEAGTKEVAEQLAGAKRRLDEAATALKNYKLANGTIDLSEEAKARLGQTNQIEISLRDLQGQRASNVAEIEVLTRQAAAMPQVQVIPERIVRRPELETLQNQMTQLELARIATLRRYREGSPEVKAIEDQRAAIAARLQTVAQTQVSSWIRSVNPIRQGLKQQIARLQSQIWAGDARTKALQNASRLARQQQALLPEREYRLNQLSTEQAVLQQTYQVLNEKYQSLLVSEGAKLTTASVLAPAEVPDAPIRPRRALNMVMAALLGLISAIALALLAEHIDDRLQSGEGAAAAAQLPLLAQVPWVDTRDLRSLLGQNGVASPLRESFRQLRTNVMLAAPQSATGAVMLPHSVLITSSQEGEGKSLCALNLAIAAAQSGTQVVLIDCDLRHPSLHTWFGLNPKRGLSDVLAGELSLEEALQESGVRGLRVLTCGSHADGSHTDGSSGEAGFHQLDSNAARLGLQSIVARAEFAVLDCPPVSSGADAQIVATIAETALLVVSSESAEGSEVSRARELLERTGVHLLGLVWNETKPTETPFAALVEGRRN